LEIIGEAARRISQRFREKHEHIPWRQITGTRDRLIHGYDEVDLDIVWQIVTKDLPTLLAELEKILPSEQGGHMEFYEVVRKRSSIRKYKDRPVEEEKLRRILEAARLAPSAANRQPWHFIVVRDPKVKEELKAAYGREWFYTAPVIICACGDPSSAWVRSDGKSYLDVDVAIAMEHLILAAAAEGLGTCWIGAFDEEAVKKALGIPEGISVIALTPLGYPAEEKGEKVRKSTEDIVHYERW